VTPASEWLQFIGSFHPLVVHFPIALILVLPVFELAARRPRRESLRSAAGFVLTLAMIAALVAPALGWCLMHGGGISGPLMTQHMLGGISVAVVTFACWLLRGRSSLYFVLLAIAVGLVSWTGYRGGQLAHGENHLTEHMPEPLRRWLGVSAAAASAADPKTFYGARIAPIFAARCALCHGANKQRAKLRLDDYAFIMRGGKDGSVVKAGDPAGSEIVRRISLPPGADDFMPAEGKPPLDAAQIQLIKLWIAAGASATQAVDAIAGAPVMEREPEKSAPDYTPQEQQIGTIEAALGVRLLPRSQIKTDGLTLRCVSAPQRCDDAAIEKLAAIAPLIVDAELARSAVTDAGLETLSRFENLRYLDLSRTSVTGVGVRKLVALQKLERLNLTGDSVSDGDLAALRQSKALKHVYAFAQ
jgi:uncharacterized membrane protein/mono/diheme cytochrome c family protein